MRASKRSPATTDTIGPSAPVSTRSPARRGWPKAASLRANQTAAMSGWPRQVTLQNERNLGFDFGLQRACKRHLFVVTVKHVRKEGAEVRLVHAELSLHGRRCQADLAADYSAPLRHGMCYVGLLDGICEPAV